LSKDNIAIEPFAISESNDTVPLFFEEQGSGLGSLTKRRLDHFGIDFSQQKQVHSIVFEDYWKDKLKCRHIDVVKLDIEGHELVALDSFGKALHAIDIIQSEYLNKPRQVIEYTYTLNGAIVVCRSSIINEGINLYLNGTYAYEMDPKCSIDIDSSIDFDFAEFMINKQLEAS